MACDYIIQCVDVRSLKNDFQGARIYHTVNPDCCCKGQMMTLNGTCVKNFDSLCRSFVVFVWLCDVSCCFVIGPWCDVMDSVVCVIDSCFQREEVWRVLSEVTGVSIGGGCHNPAVCAVLQPTVSSSQSEMWQHMNIEEKSKLLYKMYCRLSLNLWFPSTSNFSIVQIVVYAH